jgi:hypothetical protein
MKVKKLIALLQKANLESIVVVDEDNDLAIFTSEKVIRDLGLEEAHIVMNHEIFRKYDKESGTFKIA